MTLSEVFLSLGEQEFGQLVCTISLGRLKTYQLYDRLKTRSHLPKLNAEGLRKSGPRFWTRLSGQDEELASDLAQGILVSHIDMLRAVLDFLGVPNENGFFAKDLEASKYLTEGWQERVWEKFRETYPRGVLLFYINHLAWELAKDTPIFAPQASEAKS
jgi:hypothetical protein